LQRRQKKKEVDARHKAGHDEPECGAARHEPPDLTAMTRSAMSERRKGETTVEKFTVLEGVAAPLRMINVDTDAIIPKQYLKTVGRTGLGKGLFAEKRYRDDGSENPDFILNKPAYRNAKILVADDNFGCGSSREHAPWALLDFGIRCVISTSFGDIFHNNCFKNGVLPIRVEPEDLEKLFDDAERGANATLTIDLPNQEIRGPDGGVVKFDVDPFRKHCLLNGLDDIGLTMEKAGKIAGYEETAKAARPWA
jgi:3-isopropylmalate/(R)-2-methylmalate dehydratase small subunit